MDIIMIMMSIQFLAWQYRYLASILHVEYLVATCVSEGLGSECIPLGMPTIRAGSFTASGRRASPASMPFWTFVTHCSVIWGSM